MHFYFDWSNGTRMLLVLVVLILSSPILIYVNNKEKRVRAKLEAKFPNEDFNIRGSVLGMWPFGHFADGYYSYNPELNEQIKIIREVEGRPANYIWIPWVLASIAILI